MILFWLIAVVSGAVGLRTIAPRRAPLLYLGPAVFTVALLALPVLYIATIWSH